MTETDTVVSWFLQGTAFKTPSDTKSLDAKVPYMRGTEVTHNLSKSSCILVL